MATCMWQTSRNDAAKTDMVLPQSKSNR